MKKVLIITYYWPPAGGPAVQRWVKFVKYLRSFDWEPVVYVPENPDYPVIDNSFTHDLPENPKIISAPIWEPYDAYRRFLGLGKNEKFNQGGFIKTKETSRLKNHTAKFIRGNFFIPDARRFWIKPSVQQLTPYLREHPVDIMVTTGPPHSLHLIGLTLKERLGIPWVADFRDPWTRIYYFEDLLLTPMVKRKHRRLEKRVLQKADRVITVGRTIAEEFSEAGEREIDVIPNGYDPDDFANRDNEPDPEFTLVHTGNISESKNSPLFWESIRELREEIPGLKEDLLIKLVGNIDYSVDAVIKENGLEDAVEKRGFVSHDSVTIYQQKAQLLLLFISNTAAAKGAVSGRVFEYLASGRPVMAITHPEGDLASIIHNCRSGQVIDFDDKTSMKAAIRTYYEQYKEYGVIPSVQNMNHQTYSRKSLTGELTGLFEAVISGR